MGARRTATVLDLLKLVQGTFSAKQVSPQLKRSTLAYLRKDGHIVEIHPRSGAIVYRITDKGMDVAIQEAIRT